MTQISKAGGIYIEIVGDTSKFEKDLRVARQTSKGIGAEISQFLRIPIDHKPFTKTLMKARVAGQAMSADFSSQQKAFRELGETIGVTGKSLNNFAALQTKALKNQSAKAFTSAYSLALELGWSDVDAMLESMTAIQLQEWFAFFRIRDEKGDKPQGGYGTWARLRRSVSLFTPVAL